MFSNRRASDGVGRSGRGVLLAGLTVAGALLACGPGPTQRAVDEKPRAVAPKGDAQPKTGEERGAEVTPPGRKEMAMETVIVNGRSLSEDEIAEIERMYGVPPKPGRYWYDARSGLYGVIGHPAYGFMNPGHGFGTLPAGSSRGDSGVFINGREIPHAEWLLWSQMVGSPILPGRYWFDASGNAGLEGNPLPLVNLHVAARQRGGSGGGGGDGFWSSRFSSGNSTADNSQGYVSVPGHGPVGYGF